MASFDNLSISSSNKDNINRTEQTVESKEDVYPIATNITLDDRTKSHSDADMTNLEANSTPETLSNKVSLDQTCSYSSQSTGAISTSNKGLDYGPNVVNQTSTQISGCQDEAMDIGSVLRPRSGNGDAGLMETPKSSMRNPCISNAKNEGVDQPVFLLG